MHKVLLSFALFVVVFGVVGTGALAATTYPASLTARNLYSNLAYRVLGRQSENSQGWYVQDILAQAQKPIVTASPTGIWQGQPVTATTLPLSDPHLEARVLPASTGDDSKWIDINLTTQSLQAKEGDNVVYEAKVSSGMPWTPTPTGEFRIWIKVPTQTMKGGSKETGDYYYLPNVTYVMYFHNGYGLHTAYWHHNFGHPMSHGCVNLAAADAKWLYEWATPVVPPEGGSVKSTADNPGTRVVIHT